MAMKKKEPVRRKGSPKPVPKRAGKPAKKPAAARRGEPILNPADVRMMLLELARRIAPADVAELLAHEAELRGHDWELKRDHLSLLRDQLDCAFDCLRDHVHGACPQIPFFTVALLASAVSYFGDEFDFIPDFLPRIGRLDDAVVMAMAFQIGAEGIQRYCAWKGRAADRLLHPVAIHGA